MQAPETTQNLSSAGHVPVWKREMPGAGAVVALTLIGLAPLLIGGTRIGQDTAAFFAPIYALLADQITNGHLPVWNPYQFSGIPLLADPESGWLYWPAMVLFALLPVASAVRFYLILHLLMAGLGMYAFGRLLRLSTAGAITAAVAYQFSGMVYGRSVCCPAYIQVSAWLPVAFIGLELAIRSTTWLPRLSAIWLAGFAVSQIIASWLGQGTYYALLALGAYAVYRCLIAPPAGITSWRERLRALFVCGPLLILTGVGLAAAAILPRFEFRAASTLAEGYVGELAWAARQGGWTLADLDNRLFTPGTTYLGVSVLVLAIAGVALSRRRYLAPFFALLTIGTLLLVQRGGNLLQSVLFLTLPEFEELHHHWPERAMVIFYVAPAMLAGAAVTRLQTMPRPAWLPRGVLRRLALPAAIIVIVTGELLLAGQFLMRNGPYGGFHKLDLDEYFGEPGAVEFLEANTGAEPFRVAGYNPVYREIEAPNGQVTYYRYHFVHPGARALLVNNQGMLHHIPDVQGYNPLQLQGYVTFLAALNGTSQEYHGSWLLPSGLDSPLLDLLGVRYLILPAPDPGNHPQVERLAATMPVVYEDEEVRIVENGEAFPRAWLVHDVRIVDEDRIVPVLSDPSLDFRATAIVSNPPEELAPPPAGAVERVTMTLAEPGRVRFSVSAATAALLVTSEVDYPAWNVYVDGERMEVTTVNGAFRGVAIPAGAHDVEFRYESRPLTVGLAISGLAYLAMAGTFIVAAVRHRQRTGVRAPMERR